MEKRVLPPRVNRGRRPQPSQQQNARDDVIYDQIFQNALKQAPKSPTEKLKTQQRLQNAQNQLQHRQLHSNNRVCYPYSRGYHYFFDLNSFLRVQDSVSYAVDEQNIFNTTYSQENKVIREGLTVGQLFNRKLFGLPVCSPCNLGLKTKDKNICHSYLFINQDRKFNIDRNIYELKQIYNRYDELQRRGEIKKFTCLRKDIDLISILEDQLSLQDKKAILAKKIKILSEKKESMKNYVILQDKYFFHHSLNQKLHDQIQQKTNQLTVEYIIGYLYVYDVLREKIKSTQKQNERKQQLKKLLSYTLYQRPCVSQQLIQKINKMITLSRFCEKQENSPLYLISAPFAILDFSNTDLMAVCQKVLALKCVHQSQALFYMCKMFWKRIFNRDLILNKQFKPLMRPEYDKAMNLTVTQLQRWKKQQQKKGEQKNNQQKKIPIVDPILDLNVFEPESKSFDLFRLKDELQIGIRQYISIMLFYELYLSMEEISEFSINNGVLSELIAGDFFNRGNNFITEVTGSARVGLIQQILRRLTQNIIKQQIQSETFKIKWVYNDQLGVAYLVKSSPQSDWETEKEQQNQNQQEKVYQKDDQQQVLDLGPQKKVFK